jgi:hypothetical protein
VAELWQEEMESEWYGMVTDERYAKTLDFARGCNSIQINWLNFQILLHSGP